MCIYFGTRMGNPSTGAFNFISCILALNSDNSLDNSISTSRWSIREACRRRASSISAFVGKLSGEHFLLLSLSMLAFSRAAKPSS